MIRQWELVFREMLYRGVFGLSTPPRLLALQAWREIKDSKKFAHFLRKCFLVKLF